MTQRVEQRPDTPETPGVGGPVAPPPQRRYGRLVAIGLVVAVAGAVPYLVGPFYVGVGTEILIFAVWAMSLNVLAGQTGLVSLGHASLLGVAAYTIGIVQRELHWGFLSAAVVAVLVTMAVSAVFAVLAVRSTGVYFLMITLAQGRLVWGIAQRWVTFTGGDNRLRGFNRPDVVDAYWLYYWFALAVALACFYALWRFQQSTLGLRLRGTRDSFTRMASLGYWVMWQRFIAFNVAGFFAAIAGVLYAGHFRFVGFA
jgi:branched-chain amino acid transport system permease protein